MCVKDMDGRVEAQGVQVKMMTPGKFASISAPVMILRRCLPPPLGTIRFEDPKQMANEYVSSTATGGISQVPLKSQTTMSFGAQNSSLGRGGNQGSEAPRAFFPAQGWQVAKQRPRLRSFRGPFCYRSPAEVPIPSHPSRGRGRHSEKKQAQRGWHLNWFFFFSFSSYFYLYEIFP